MKNLENTLKPEVVVSKIPLNTPVEYSLNQELPWVEELLTEMCEHASEFTLKILKPRIFLRMELEITKKSNQQLGEFVLIKGAIESSYATECVKSLKPMLELLEFEFNACFLSEELNQEDQYSEIDELFEEDDVYQIYFYRKNLANIKEMLHESIYLHYNQYPTIDTQLEKSE